MRTFLQQQLKVCGKNTPAREDCSADTYTLLVSRTRTNFAETAFNAAGPRVSSNLPMDLRQPAFSYGRFRQLPNTWKVGSPCKVNQTKWPTYFLHKVDAGGTAGSNFIESRVGLYKERDIGNMNANLQQPWSHQSPTKTLRQWLKYKLGGTGKYEKIGTPCLTMGFHRTVYTP